MQRYKNLFEYLQPWKARDMIWYFIFSHAKFKAILKKKIEEIIKKWKKIETFNNVQKSKLKKGIWVTGVMSIANKK